MLLDHQATALFLLGGDDGLVGAPMPGLLGTDAITLLYQGALNVVQVGAMVVFLAATQQMQVRAGGVGNHFSSVQDQIPGLLKIHYHQGIANGVHGRTPVREY
ncbi:hypothetical protein D3C84_773850 [compost metagenome]